MKRLTLSVWAVAVVSIVGGCAVVYAPAAPSRDDILAELKQSFSPRGIAQLDRLDQTELQLACTEAAEKGSDLPKETRAKLEKVALDSVEYPSDGNYLGDWKQGEKVAQSGLGMQFSDTAATINGGNCYACHQLAPQEISYGNIGPSLYQYGKLRGSSDGVLKYTWGKIWNSHAYNACSIMPRFGAAGILTQQQLKDVMALLLDPASPVNQ